MIKAILFDFNGVIIDDEPIQMKAYQEVLKDEGIDLTEEDYYSCLGMDDITFVAEAFKRAGKTVEANKILELTQAKSNLWRDKVADNLPLFEGAENFIRKMSRQFTLGIVSMAQREEIEYVLERANLLDCFSAIVSAEDVSAPKPNPECYRIGFRLVDAAHTAHKHLPITHDECLVIEDSPPGILAAKAADLKTLAVTNTVSEAEMREVGADAVAKNLDDWMPESLRRVFA
ncbi:MAG TPA: HAD family phosphatase [Pyrinomonadaceae bacterium]|nr:HAD family phosphatase [Pyrinomonadaceae bacterium]